VFITTFTQAIRYKHPPIQYAPRALSQAAKNLECGTDHLLPYTAEDKNTLSSFTLYSFICSIMFMDSES
jgi:hypothetical protein